MRGFTFQSRFIKYCILEVSKNVCKHVVVKMLLHCLQELNMHQHLFWVAVGVLQQGEPTLYSVGLELMEACIKVLSCICTHKKMVSTMYGTVQAWNPSTELLWDQSLLKSARHLCFRVVLLSSWTVFQYTKLLLSLPPSYPLPPSPLPPHLSSSLFPPLLLLPLLLLPPLSPPSSLPFLLPLPSLSPPLLLLPPLSPPSPPPSLRT